MEALNGLFAVLVLVSFIALLIGLIKPTWIKLKNRKMVSIVTSVAILVFMILFSLTQSDEQKAQIKATQEKIELEKATKVNSSEKEIKKPTEVKVTESPKNLGLSAKEFRIRFNQKLQQTDYKGLKALSNLNIEEIDGNKSFTADLTPSISMWGEVNGADDLTAISLVMGKHLDKNAALDYIALSSILTSVISPNDKEALPETIELLERAVNSPNTGVYEKAIGNATYKIIPSDTIGLWFSIFPKE